MARLTFDSVHKYAENYNYSLKRADGYEIPKTYKFILFCLAPAQGFIYCKSLGDVLTAIVNGVLLEGCGCYLPEPTEPVVESEPEMAEPVVELEERTEETITEETMKTLYIVRGIPGNGKTPLAKALATYTVCADDMPELYDDGAYQNHLQKASHDWCYEEIEQKMMFGYSYIAVHNTFTRIFYIKPYIELANKYGYSVHIIHSEAVLTAGGRTTDTHDVPANVLQSMRNSWENWDTLPKLGMTAKDIAEQIAKAKAYPDAIVFDMDGTIKRTQSGETFPQSPDDFEITPEFINFASYGWIYDTPLYIASNQRGLTGGQKTEDFLDEERADLQIYLDKNCDIHFQDCYFLTNKYALKSGNGFTHIDGNFAKPSPAIFDLIHRNSNRKNYWIIGDAHNDERSEDWQFAQNCQKAHPELNIVYIPIELAATFYKLHHT